MKCSDGKVLTAHGYSKGSWLNWKYCSAGEYIFGMSKWVRSRDHQKSIENFKFECQKPPEDQCESIVLSGTCIDQTENAASLLTHYYI